MQYKPNSKAIFVILIVFITFILAFNYINRNKQEFTFWDYTSGSWQRNNGLRIDHFLVSNNILKNVQNIFINKKPRSKIKPSDHTPIELDIN